MTANRLSAILGLLLLAAAFLIPAIALRSPVLYPDTIGYHQSGRSALMAAHLLPRTKPAVQGQSPTAKAATAASLDVDAEGGISTARSIYYGALFALVELAGGLWAMAALQSLLVVAAVHRALHWFAPAAPARLRIAAVAITGLVGGAGAFASVLMPDLFAGMLILSVTLLLLFAPAMKRGEWLAWVALALAAILFHKSHLLLAAALLLVGAVLFLLRRVVGRSLVLLAALIAVGGAGHLAVDVAVRRILHKEPTSPPFVLARMVGDGTAGLYLRDVCPGAALQACAVLPHLPMTENEFLWNGAAGGFASMTPEQKRRVIAEERPIALGVARAHGWTQVRASASNAARQFLLVGVAEYALAPTVKPATARGLEAELARYQQQTIAERLLVLRPQSLLIGIGYFAALAALAVLLVTDRRRKGEAGQDRTLATAAWLVAGGLVANAAICGAISGVFDRYQGRVAWAAVTLALAYLLTRRSNDPAAAARPATLS